MYAGGDCTALGQDLTVQAVQHGKLAAEAELREGDIILSANLKPIKSVEEFSKIIREDAKKRGVVMLQLCIKCFGTYCFKFGI